MAESNWDPIKFAHSYQRELFGICREFFVKATGKNPEQFSNINEFSELVNANPDTYGSKLVNAYEWFIPKISHFYSENARNAFNASCLLGGNKLVLSGSRFLETHLNSTLASCLNSDTVLIPDPVLPWIEVERNEEKFSFVLLLQGIHYLLMLEKLVQADVEIPPVFVFPSFDKYLERNDEQTKRYHEQTVVTVLNKVLKEKLSNYKELLDYIDLHSDEFAKMIEESDLIIPPGNEGPTQVEIGIESYRHYIEKYRTPDCVENFDNLSTGGKLFVILAERITPQCQLIENCQEIRGNPLVPISQQAHYFKIVCSSMNTRLHDLGYLRPETRAKIEVLSHERLEWLKKVPIDLIIELKKSGEVKEFQSRLGCAISRLHESSMDNLDLAATEVCHEIAGMILEHNLDLKRIQEKYNKMHGDTLKLAFGGTVAVLMPALAPLLGVTPVVGLIGKYGVDKWRESREFKAASRSLVGVLATARDGKSKS